MRSAGGALVRKALGASPGEHIADIGCGPGFYCSELAQEVGASGSVVGVDASVAMLELASRRWAALPNVALNQAEATSLPLPRMRRMLETWDEHLTHRSLPRTLIAQLRAAGFEHVVAEAYAFTTVDFTADGLRHAASDHRGVRRRPERDHAGGGAGLGGRAA